jgi:hypothetical protein
MREHIQFAGHCGGGMARRFLNLKISTWKIFTFGTSRLLPRKTCVGAPDGEAGLLRTQRIDSDSRIGMFQRLRVYQQCDGHNNKEMECVHLRLYSQGFRRLLFDINLAHSAPLFPFLETFWNSNNVKCELLSSCDASRVSIASQK